MTRLEGRAWAVTRRQAAGWASGRPGDAMWGRQIVLLASLLASAAGFALPAPGGLRIRAMAPGDILSASRLLLSAFTEGENVNGLSKALIFAEHVVGLRERYGQNVILVAEQPAVKDELVGTACLPAALLRVLWGSRARRRHTCSSSSSSSSSTTTTTTGSSSSSRFLAHAGVTAGRVRRNVHARVPCQQSSRPAQRCRQDAAALRRKPRCERRGTEARCGLGLDARL